jgi:inosine/xanthosine triphosphatase
VFETNRIYIGSKNPTKIKAVQIALDKVKEQDPQHQLLQMEVCGDNVPSGVSDQPKDDQETIQGAINRCNALQEKYPDSICIGLEGGVQESEHGLLLCNWGALLDQNGRLYVAGGARIPLPEEVAHGIREGKELGDVIDLYANQSNVRKNEGAIGILSHGFIDRPHMFSQVALLLIGQMLHYSVAKI